MYNPLTCKKPYGATVVGEKTSVQFPLPPDCGVERVFIVLRKDGEEETSKIELKLKRLTSAHESNGEVIFAGDFKVPSSGIWKYRFEGELKNGGIAFYGRAINGDALRGDWLPEWQLTVTKTDYKTPDWAKTGVIYHIFADRFCKSGERAFLKKGRLHDNWYDLPDIPDEGAEYRADDFFGGNIAGIISKLDYLESLGVKCIYLSPIFESSSNHRYDTGDYMCIDELFGDEKQFSDLIYFANEKGIKIILDGVFNHTGADSVYFNKFGNYAGNGAFQSEESSYYDWFYFHDYPEKYHCWWGSTVVPTVNKNAKGFRNLILGEGGVIEKWQTLGVKGWRLDVVDELPVDFTYDICKKIKEADKDALIIGEVWEDATTKISYDELRPYFMGGQLDGVMNYPFKLAITEFAVSGDKNKFVEIVGSILENYPKESLDVLMNLIGSHDTVRVMTLLSGVKLPENIADRNKFRLNAEEYANAKNRLKFAATLQYTLPGVPCLYYGDEAGAEGAEDPMNRATYPWGKEDGELLAYYRKLGVMREKYKKILLGETRFIDDETLLIFERSSKNGNMRVYANGSDRAIEKDVLKLNAKDAFTGESALNFILKPLEIKIIVF